MAIDLADTSPRSPGAHGPPELLVPLPYPAAVPLRGVVQHYAWGKCHETSLVAAMATEQVRSQRGPMRAPPLSRGNRFAELWMGTHPNGPSSVVVPGRGKSCGADTTFEEIYLKDAISSDPAFWLGAEDAERLDLPYLFKVLAVRQALSIQAHPNKQLAEELHQRLPAHYPDANHKPEICIPLGYFEALCGFRPIAEVRHFVRTVPELRALCCTQQSSWHGSCQDRAAEAATPCSAANAEAEGAVGVGGLCAPSMQTQHACHSQRRSREADEEEPSHGSGDGKVVSPGCLLEDDIHRTGLKELYGRLMRSNSFEVQRQVKALVARLGGLEDRTVEEDLILRVERDYPGDVGIFSIFFLNYVRITPGSQRQYIYCAPDEPHAYLLGDAVECMAISDNVVRAGLTLKHKDVDTLLGMMTYRDDLLSELVRTGERVAKHVVKYNPPVDDFVVFEVDGPVPEGYRLPHAAITACVQGSFTVDFRPPRGEPANRGLVDASGLSPHEHGPQQVLMGHTFFSRAGTNLVILSMEQPGRLFIASY